MRFWDSVIGRVKCRLISPSLEQSINRITHQCNISDLELIDELTATFWLHRADLGRIQHTNDRFEVIGHSGLFWTIDRLKKRPVLLAGIMLLICLIFFLPTRVLFVSVHGNDQVSDTTILDAAQNCGIVFGASREHVRSEKIKNALLRSIPQLQWACINTKGCVAEITVQERLMDNNSESCGLSNIVAGRDGIITGITVYSGTPLCRVGQVVKKGQLLVSGLADLGLVIKSCSADAEITAETTHSVTAVVLPVYTKVEENTKIENRYSLLIGKKLIKFYKDSGILSPECGRINKIYNLILPGGYPLPISVIREQVLHRNVSTCVDNETDAFPWLSDAADTAVQSEMIAGEIIKRASESENDGSLCRFRAHYRCREMIAVVQKKELFTVDGKRN